MSQRRQREIEAMKEKIIDAANAIIKKEGLEKLSIRSIAKKIEYSPSIIYHYFKDKDEILHHIMRIGYQKIINAVSLTQIEGKTPQERLIQMSENYIRTALSMPSEFLTVQLNDSPQILAYTSSLFVGASNTKPALKALYDCLNDHYNDLSKAQLELKAQMIAVSTLGMIIKLIIEKDLDDKQKNKLIHYFSHVVIQNIAFNDDKETINYEAI